MKIRDPRARDFYVGGDCDESITADTVIEDAPAERIDTGLLDANGEPIYRPRLTVKFGFVGG